MIGETKGLRAGMQSALHLLFPPQCLGCNAPVASDFGLCPDCWRGTPFIAGLVCDRCGTPLPGEGDGEPVCCDDCLTIARPWGRGRAALLYRDTGRKLVLSLKHGDRQELARPAAVWMLRAARPILVPEMLVVPVPLHWSRLLKRRFNQSALLSKQLAVLAGLDHCPDLLRRGRRTESQDGRDRDGRFLNVRDAIVIHPGRRRRAAGRPVLLVDDVMTSGATLAVAAEACLAAGAHQVSIVTLARVAKDA
jgi:ComF family protein